MTSAELVAALAKRTELSPLIASSSVRRACERAGVSAQRLDVKDLEQIMPELEIAVRTFHDDSRAVAIIASLRKFREDVVARAR
ncbi:MAG: hypothetical protein AB7S26_17130 [Sandaracinaceae bacterium]